MSISVGRVEAVILNGVELRAGDRVKVRINGSYQALSGTGVIEVFGQAADGRTQVVVQVEEELGAFHRSDLKLALNLDEIEAGEV